MNNPFRANSGIVGECKPCHNSQRLMKVSKRGEATCWRIQENSFDELLTVMACYLPPNGIVVDAYCGTAVSCLAAIKMGAGMCVMNDRDSKLVSAVRERCLRYWYGLKSARDWPSEGTRVPLRSVELTSPHILQWQKF